MLTYFFAASPWMLLLLALLRLLQEQDSCTEAKTRTIASHKPIKRLNTLPCFTNTRFLPSRRKSPLAKPAILSLRAKVLLLLRREVLSQDVGQQFKLRTALCKRKPFPRLIPKCSMANRDMPLARPAIFGICQVLPCGSLARGWTHFTCLFPFCASQPREL